MTDDATALVEWRLPAGAAKDRNIDAAEAMGLSCGEWRLPAGATENPQRGSRHHGLRGLRGGGPL
ncbi:hypothetical protein ABT063_43390 [Streptomyces sp. NPDC002838]|uniref:hypothetical protein n=1 Tax=Streptomyces sp. NPDC002838 TaxID=3154436 RepID=UPI0033339E0D